MCRKRAPNEVITARLIVLLISRAFGSSGSVIRGPVGDRQSGVRRDGDRRRSIRREDRRGLDVARPSQVVKSYILFLSTLTSHVEDVQNIHLSHVDEI